MGLNIVSSLMADSVGKIEMRGSKPQDLTYDLVTRNYFKKECLSENSRESQQDRSFGSDSTEATAVEVASDRKAFGVGTRQQLRPNAELY